MDRPHRHLSPHGDLDSRSPHPPLGTTSAQTPDRLSGIRRLLVFDVVGPLIVYLVLTGQGASHILALLLSGILPAIGVLIGVCAHRSLDLLGAIVLAGVAVGVIVGVSTHSSHAVLIDSSALTGAFSIAALASLLARRPLVFQVVLAAMGGPHTDAGVKLDRRYATQPGLAQYFRTVTLVWGIAFLLEAGLKVVIIQTTSTAFALTLTRTSPYALSGILLLWMILWARTRRPTLRQPG